MTQNGHADGRSIPAAAVQIKAAAPAAPSTSLRRPQAEQDVRDKKSWHLPSDIEHDVVSESRRLSASALSGSGAPGRRTRDGERGTKRRSGGFLLGHTFGGVRGVVGNGAVGGEKVTPFREVMGLDHLPGQNTPSPRSSKSWKSQGKAPEQPAVLVGNTDSPQINSRKRTRLAEMAPKSDMSSAASETSETSSQRSTLDPNQLIQMALSLNEGRRRAASGVTAPPRASPQRRIASQGTRRLSVAPGSPLANDAVQNSVVRRQSRIASLSPDLTRSTPQTAPNDSPPTPDAPAIEYDFSLSTLQRAERARRYFEMCHQHRRLLDTLPPLKPDSSAPGNTIIRTDSTPGGAFPNITRTPTNAGDRHALGRAYNPLQYLRNETLRERVGKTLVPAPEQLGDQHQVADYIDSVQQAAGDDAFRPSPDIVSLPDWGRSSPNEAVDDAPGHTRNATASSKVLWFSSGWSFTPADLIADTLWSEDLENKCLLEGRRGQRIFPELSASLGKAAQSRGAPPRSRHASGTDASRDPRGRQKRKFLSMHRTDSEGRRKTRWTRTRSLSSSRASSRSSVSAFITFGKQAADGINIGPLVRHMEKQLRQAEADDASELVSPDQWESFPVEPERSRGPSLRSSTYGRPSFARSRSSKPKPLDLHKSRSFTGPTEREDERLKLDMRAADDTAIDGLQIQSAFDTSGRYPLSATSYQSSHISPGNTALSTVGHGPFDVRQTQVNDFAGGMPSPLLSPRLASRETRSQRNSIDSTRSYKFTRQTTNNSITSVQSKAPAGQQPFFESNTLRGHGKSVSRIIKGSRIADLVRSEGSKKSAKSRRGTETSPTRGDSGQDMPGEPESDDETSITRSQTDPSYATGRPDRSKYHIALPSFRFPEGSQTTKPLPNDVDPITRQHSIRKEQSMVARHNKMHPPDIEVPGKEHDPGQTQKGEDVSMIRGLLSPIKRLRSSTNPSRSNSYRQAPSSQASKLSLLTSAGDASSADQEKSKKQRSRQWSIADQLDRPVMTTTQSVTVRDVERVRALLLSSGIKASALTCRGSVISDKQSEILIAAAQHSNDDIASVLRKDELQTAGRMWTQLIATLHTDSSSELKAFRDETVPSLREKLEHLHYIGGEDVTTHVQTMSDEAEGFTTDLTTHQTLAVKGVHDAVDRLVRKRRRQFRWLRRIGFTALEWLLLAVMWLAWLLFVVVKVVKGAVLGLVKAFGWLFWL